VLTTPDVDVEAARTHPSPASDHLQVVAELVLPRAKEPRPRRFDLQAHRGGLGLVTESTLEAFANALELGVSTLELDVQITEDQKAVVTHDRQVSGAKCRDTRWQPRRGGGLVWGRRDLARPRNPQDGRVGDPGYRPYTTPALVAEAHESGLTVIPWTVDDPPTMASLMDAGVDGLITDYPDRLREVMADRGLTLPEPVDEPRRRCLR
jgi:glycerophosphoryl diester phosphodiesterase